MQAQGANGSSPAPMGTFKIFLNNVGWHDYPGHQFGAFLFEAGMDFDDVRTCTALTLSLVVSMNADECDRYGLMPPLMSESDCD